METDVKSSNFFKKRRNTIVSYKDIVIFVIYKRISEMNRPSVILSIKEALRRVSPNLQIILYGSEARGDARPDSDIDLLLLVDKDVVTLDDKIRLTAPLYDIELATDIQINPLIESAHEWGKRFTPFYENVQKEGIVL